MNKENTTPTRAPREDSTHAWVITLIKGIIIALFALVIFIAGCKMSLSSFEKTYGDALVPRKNVEITIDDIQYALDAEEMSDAERLEYIRSSIDVLEAEIAEEK